jgi:hypothetical protein
LTSTSIVTPPLLERAHRVLHLREVGDVHDAAFDPVPRGDQLAHGAVHRLALDVPDDEALRAPLEQPSSGEVPDPGCATGHEDRLASNLAHVPSMPGS